MSASNAPERRTLLWVLLAIVSLALLAILAPFYGTLLWSVIVALLFSPLYRRLVVRLKGRRTLAALLTQAVVVVLLVLPFVFVSAALVNEAAALIEHAQRTPSRPGDYLRPLYDMLPHPVRNLLARLGIGDVDALWRRIAAVLGQGSQFVAAQVLRIGQNTFRLVASLFIMLYVSFFLIRDGEVVARALREALPLHPQDSLELTAKFSTVIRATVKGNLLVACLQGTLGGLALWVLGVSGALLWGVVMAFLSLLPAIGAALVWAPIALYLAATGAVWKAAMLAAWGVLVIGLVDNLLRPILVGNDTRLPDYVILITTLGGMAVFGIHGFVLGPAIAAMFLAVWHIVVTKRARSTP